MANTNFLKCRTGAKYLTSYPMAIVMFAQSLIDCDIYSLKQQNYKRFDLENDGEGQGV